MEPDFWRKKWADNEIGFHEDAHNPLLVKYFKSLGLAAGARVFVPLCGKSKDLNWLLSEGFQVIGVELSEQAVEAFFSDHGLEPQISQAGPHRLYQVDGLKIYAGDFFALTPQVLGPMQAVYDRAALVALPEEMRRRYVTALGHLCPAVPHLTITLEYDQSQMKGPPFSISDAMLSDYYDASHALGFLEQRRVELRKLQVEEKAWALTPK